MISSDKRPTDLGSNRQRQGALSRWENEGGSHDALQSASDPRADKAEIPELTNTELVQLRIRVIALENLMITFLAEASHRQLELAREMAAFISPRPGSKEHPLTAHAATQMVHMIDRADHFRI